MLLIKNTILYLAIFIFSSLQPFLFLFVDNFVFEFTKIIPILVNPKHLKFPTISKYNQFNLVAIKIIQFKLIINYFKVKNKKQLK